MQPLKVEIRLPEQIEAEIAWAWDLFCSHWGIPCTITDGEGALLISKEESADIRISDRFDTLWSEKRLNNREVFPEEALLRCEDGTPDRLGTAFYMVNSCQEWGAGKEERDSLGRFLFSASYQYRLNVVERDLVSELFDELYKELGHFLGKDMPEKPASRAFLTHDMDRIERGNMREASWKLKKGKFREAIASLWKCLMKVYEWENVEGILELHEAKGMKSSFFWITEKGKDPDGIRNADHDLQKPHYRELLKKVRERGFSNGLHKSTFDSGFEEEWKKLEHATRINRNHYLKFQLPEHYELLEDAGLRLDSSLGFREAIGFRNSYGRPFHPFDRRTGKKMQLLEVPLQLMDVTLFKGHEDPIKKAERFIEEHPKGIVLTLLWHNHHLTEGRFKGEKENYEKLLDILMAHEISSVAPNELIEGKALC